MIYTNSILVILLRELFSFGARRLLIPENSEKVQSLRPEIALPNNKVREGQKF